MTYENAVVETLGKQADPEQALCDIERKTSSHLRKVFLVFGNRFVMTSMSEKRNINAVQKYNNVNTPGTVYFSHSGICSSSKNENFRSLLIEELEKPLIVVGALKLGPTEVPC